MSILMPRDTRETLGAEAAKCQSRALFVDRFSEPGAEREQRNDWFKRAIKLPPQKQKMEYWQSFCLRAGANGEPGNILRAKLRSRMMVNMAGGSMENAGLCLDRFGMPYIPGSAVKGCARRMAIQLLMEASQAAASNPQLVAMLADVAMTFGWSEEDWGEPDPKQRRISDFRFAIGGGRWAVVSIAARNLLPAAKEFAGAASFWPAYPLKLPKEHDLELDVLTSHHPVYYAKDGKMPVALDSEDPIPVVFPAVAAGMVFGFPILPLRGEHSSASQPGIALHSLAREWLRDGLETFGIGAKTDAGYGWFDASLAFNQQALTAEMDAAEKLAKRAAEDAAKETAKRLEQERLRRIQESRLIRASWTPEQIADHDVAEMTPDQFRSKMDNFLGNKAEAERAAIVRALRLEDGVPGSRRTFWEELKAKLQKKPGGKPAQISEAIRQISRELKLGKMP